MRPTWHCSRGGRTWSSSAFLLLKVFDRAFLNVSFEVLLHHNLVWANVVDQVSTRFRHHLVDASDFPFYLENWFSRSAGATASMGPNVLRETF
jgi:hypothetical protein